MLIGFVIAYLVVTIAIGLWAAKRVHNSRLFARQRDEGPQTKTKAVHVLQQAFGSQLDANLGGADIRRLGNDILDGKHPISFMVPQHLAPKYKPALLTIKPVFQ